ncbi:hypothetical protein FH972_025161 [Carpinus fangiana]|uniref:alcohol dehydrogenase (NADP(+)) n=1 Tax=Carpinus fangiana TaxID=176857 RepID=A0A5N6L2S5_9ROSI|nr:hypothetical protein FH972_025161 [Carpinus fangiana]
MSGDYTFKGWLGNGPEAAQGKMEYGEFQPKTWEETDVILTIFQSDIHTLRSGWGATLYPCCVGHEIVGRAVRVGKDVKRPFKVGDIVGVGAQSASCLKPDCEECSNGLEQHCAHITGTYNSKYMNGEKSMGGYANYARVPGHFVVKIPDGLSPAEAAPMLCGGVTSYSPLRDNGCGPGKKVGIVGFGGLGHFGVLFAKALGAEKIVAISRKNNKKEDALKMGATDYIATDEDEGWHKKNAGSLDLIVSTVSSPKMPLPKYLMLLRTHGQFIQVGAPEDALPGFNVFSLITKGAKIGGSAIGSPATIEEMLQLAVDKNVKPWIQERPMSEANAAVVDMDAGNARYRYVLVNKE